MSLPILANSFFEKHRPSLDVYLKWQKAAAWSSHFMPIYQWDDVLFVGCSIATDQTVQTSHKVVYVFCEAEILNQLWEEYQSPTVIMANNERTVVGAPVPKPVESDIPEGLTAISVNSAAPQSASFDDLGISADEIFPDDTQKLSESSEELSLDLEMPSPLEPQNAISLEMPEAPPMPVIEEEESVPVMAKPAEVEAQAEEPTPTRVTTVTSITSTNASPEQVFQSVFTEMGRNFKKTMILVKQGEQIVPWKWDESFEKSNPEHKKTAMSLAVPSPFRIVYRSQKSYHGYLVPNDLNDKFFAEWNESVNPDHLTLAPVLVDDVVVGMILGIGGKSADTKTCLLQTEHLAEAVAKRFKAQPQLTKAA